MGLGALLILYLHFPTKENAKLSSCHLIKTSNWNITNERVFLALMSCFRWDQAFYFILHSISIDSILSIAFSAGNLTVESAFAGVILNTQRIDHTGSNTKPAISTPMACNHSFTNSRAEQQTASQVLSSSINTESTRQFPLSGNQLKLFRNNSNPT